jgi:hypothetical protein
MKCCSQVNDCREKSEGALTMALDAMHALEHLGYGPPNHVAFSTLIVAINRLCSDKERKIHLLKSIFQQCSKTGNVSKQVLLSMSLGPGKDLCSVILKEWSRNVPTRDRPDAVE